jgi:predicted metal-dependent hydrolase
MILNYTWPHLFLNNRVIAYQGRPHIIKIKEGQCPAIYHQYSNITIVTGKDTSLSFNQSHLIKCQLLNWIKMNALKQVIGLIDKYGSKMGKRPRRCGVKLTCSRWGSLGINNDIYINWLLICAPDYVLEYVVIHELCHLFYRSHGIRFWNTVNQWCPTYRQAERWLRSYQARDLLTWYTPIKSMKYQHQDRLLSKLISVEFKPSHKVDILSKNSL